MPPKSIELSSGRLYLTGLDESIPVSDCEGRDETEYADEQEHINISQESFEFTLENAEFQKGWALTKCRECRYEFPITTHYYLLYGSSGWLCPRCTFIKRLEETKKRSKNDSI